MNSKLVTFTRSSSPGNPTQRKHRIIAESRWHASSRRFWRKSCIGRYTNSLESSGAQSTSHFGFRRGHSCSDLLLSVVDDWLSARDSKLCTAVVFLDLSKAFDKMWIINPFCSSFKNAELEGQFWAGSKIFLKTGDKGLFFLERVLSQTGLCATREYHKEVCWGLSSLRRFAAVSPFCFGYPAQPDIASWRIRIIHISIDLDRRFSSPLAATRQGRYPRSLEAFFFTPVDFGFQARCTGSTRTNKRRRFQKSSVVDWMMPESEEWIRRKRRRHRSIDEQTSGCMVDLLNLSWAVLCGRQCGLSFFVLVDQGNEQSFVYYGGGGLQPKTPVGADNVDSSMSIWWVYSQTASQHFFGSVVLQSSFSLSCTYALGEWSVVSHRWSRRTPAGFCISSNQRGIFTERWMKNWTFTKSELLLHRHEATAPALAKQKLYAMSMHCSWRT